MSSLCHWQSEDSLTSMGQIILKLAMCIREIYRVVFPITNCLSFLLPGSPFELHTDGWRIKCISTKAGWPWWVLMNWEVHLPHIVSLYCESIFNLPSDSAITQIIEKYYMKFKLYIFMLQPNAKLHTILVTRQTHTYYWCPSTRRP